MRLTLLGVLCIMTMACASASVDTNQEAENVRIVQQAYENFRTGNIDAIVNALSPDVEWQIPEVEGAGFSGTRRGREQVRQFFTALNQAQEVLSFEPREFIGDRDKVVVLGHYAWRVRGTGRRFENDWAMVFTLRDGQIVRFQEFTDTALVAAAYR